MKDLHEDNLFGSIRERLGRYEESPSEELWDKIASRKRDRVWPMFLEPVGIVLVGLSLFLSVEEPAIVEEKPVENEQHAQVPALPQPHAQSTTVNYTQQPTHSEPTHPEPTHPSTPSPEPRTSNVEPGTDSPIVIKKDSSIAEPVDPPAEVVPPFKKPRSRFQLFLSVTPSLSYQKMIPSEHDQLIVQGFAPRSPMSMKRFGIGIDLGFQREINNIFGYYGSLSFYQQKQELTYNYYDKDATVTRVGDSWVFEINREQHSKTFDYSMTNLGVRGGLLITLKGEKLKHKFGAGLMYTHSLNNSSSYVAYQLSYRNEVKINEHMSWFVEPTFIYSFIAKEKLNEPFTLKPYRAGITGGLLYRFR